MARMQISRRAFLTGVAGGGLALAGAAAMSRKKGTGPNVLFMPVDDLRVLLGCYGAGQIKTPNIDRFASRGVVFTHSYCQMAVCNPSRASMMTDTVRVFDLKTPEPIAPPNNPDPPLNVPAVAMHNWEELRSQMGIPKEGPLSPQMTLEIVRAYYAC